MMAVNWMALILVWVTSFSQANKDVKKMGVSGQRSKLFGPLLLLTYMWSLVVLSQIVFADAVSEQNSKTQFLHEVFGPSLPATQRLWLSASMQQSLTTLVGAPYQQAVLRYWQDPHDSTRLVLLLDAIGKEDWITAGFVVQKNTIQTARVLVYRETRGGEIQSMGFLQQFRHLQLRNQQLTQQIDGITGATLSVRAMTKMAKQALYFAEQIHAPL